MKAALLGIYAGQLGAFPADGHPTAIFKQPVVGRVFIHAEGIAGDHQADRRVHGGPEKAVHHFVADHFPRIAERFPSAAAMLLPGSIGENLSSSGLNETLVCIGDVFAVGSARLQVCQPRSPCWKMDARYGTTGLAQFVSESCINGWYYRVLEKGEVEAGNEVQLVDRPGDAVSVAEFWRGWRTVRDVPHLKRLSALPGLASVFQRYLADRIAWLRAHPREEAAAIPACHPRKT